jgi:hypothetical protein
MEQEKKMENLPARQLKPEEIRRYNSVITQLLSLFLNFAPDAIVVDTVREISKSCNVSMEFAYAQYLAALCGLDSSGAHKDFFRNYFLPMVHELDPETFEEDAYFRNIKIPAQKSGKWDLKTETLQTCEAFVCNDFQIMPDGRWFRRSVLFCAPSPTPPFSKRARMDDSDAQRNQTTLPPFTKPRAGADLRPRAGVLRIHGG